MKYTNWIQKEGNQGKSPRDYVDACYENDFRIDFSDAKLTGANLNEANLTWANLNEADRLDRSDVLEEAATR